jgi:hypothetical protein
MSDSNSKTSPLVWVAIGCGGLLLLAALLVLFGTFFFGVSTTSTAIPAPSPSPTSAPAAPQPPAPQANPSER